MDEEENNTMIFTDSTYFELMSTSNESNQSKMLGNITVKPETDESSFDGYEDCICPVCNRDDVRFENQDDFSRVVGEFDEMISFAESNDSDSEYVMYFEELSPSRRSVIKTSLIMPGAIESVEWIDDTTCRVTLQKIKAECNECGFSWSFNKSDVDFEGDPRIKQLSDSLDAKKKVVEKLLKGNRTKEKMFDVLLDIHMDELKTGVKDSSSYLNRTDVKSRVQSIVESGKDEN